MEHADSVAANMLGDREDAEAQRNVLHLKIIDIAHQLDLIRWRWEEANPNACWDAAPNRLTSVSMTEDGNPVFETVLHFYELGRAIEANHFNVIKLLLHSISSTAGLSLLSTAQAIGASAPIGPFSNPLLLPGEGTREQNALEICRTVDYMVLGEHDCRGAFILVFPLRVAYGNLEGRQDVRQWLQRLLAHISTTKGFQIGEHVLGLSPETVKPSS